LPKPLAQPDEQGEPSGSERSDANMSGIMNPKELREFLNVVGKRTTTAKMAAVKLVHDVEILLQAADKNRNDAKKLKEELEKLDNEFKEKYPDSEHHPEDTIERAHKQLDNLLKPPEKKSGQQGTFTTLSEAKERQAAAQLKELIKKLLEDAIKGSHDSDPQKSLLIVEGAIAELEKADEEFKEKCPDSTH